MYKQIENELTCSNCGSSNIYFRREGNEIKGCKKALCGDCGHSAVLNNWNYGENKSYVLNNKEINKF